MIFRVGIAFDRFSEASRRIRMGAEDSLAANDYENILTGNGGSRTQDMS